VIVTLCATLCVIQNYRSLHGIDDSSNDKGEELRVSFQAPRDFRAYNKRLLAHHVGNTASTTSTTTTPRPYFLDGKQFGEIPPPPPEAPFGQHRLYQKQFLQHNKESSTVNVSSWMLVDPMTHSFRNHDSLLLEYTTTTRTTTNNSSAGARASQEHAQEGGSLHTPQYTWPTFSLYSSHGFVDGQALGAQKHRCC
jgi:hypothetical protein